MDKVQIYPQGLGEYERTLGLRWPVSYYLMPEAHTCQVVCDGKKRMCEIWINGTTYRNPDLMFADVIHELCHCSLAERIDPTFSTVFFYNKWNEISRKEEAQFGQLARMLYYAWSHVDIWVNDLRFTHWSELTKEDHNTFAQGMAAVVQAQEWRVLQSPETVLGLAQYQAERNRHHVNTPDLFAFLEANGVGVDDQIRKLAIYFESLPRLKFNPRKDLKALERSVQDVAKMLNFPISPRLVWEERWVWSLD